MWNFNTGLCLRTMNIEYMCEVTNCFWVEGRYHTFTSQNLLTIAVDTSKKILFLTRYLTP